MAAQIIGGAAAAIYINQALYGNAPSNAIYTSDLAYINSTSTGAYAVAKGALFASTSNDALATLVLNNLGITATTVPAASYTILQAAVATQFGLYPTMRGQVVLNLANILANFDTTDATWGAAAIAWNASAVNSLSYSADTTHTTSLAVNPAIATGHTYTLTTSSDGFTGTSGNDLFDGNTASTLSAFDVLNGGAGADTLVAQLTGASLPGGMTVSNIETATLNDSNAGFTADVSGWTGLTKATVQTSVAGADLITAAATTAVSVAATGASSVEIDGGGVTASVVTGAAAVDIGKTGAAINAFSSIVVAGGSTVDIADNKTAAANSGLGTTLTSVSVTGNTGLVTVKAGALTTLNLASDTAGATVTAAAGTRALTVGLNTVTGGTIADATATSIAINNTGGVSSGVTVNAAAATSATVSAVGKALTLVALSDTGTAKLATVGISGDAAVTITGDTLKSTAVITSTNTGGVTLSQALTVNQQFVGTSSSGADSIGVGATTTAITTGDGADTVTWSAAAVGTGGSINGGAGADTLSMTAANAATASSTDPLGAAFVASVTNFETLAVTVGTTDTINIARLGFTNLTVASGAGSTAETIDGAVNGSTLTINTGVLAGGTHTVNSTAALLSGLTDTLNVAVTGDTTVANRVASSGVTATDFETVAVTSNYDAAMTSTNKTAALTGSFANQVTILGNQATTITVGGAAGLNLTAADTALTVMDASGMTVGATGEFSWTAGALAGAATVKGAAAAINTIDFHLATGGSITYTGGTGNDVIVGQNGKANTVNLGNGTNSYTHAGSAGVQTVTGGTGVDTITGGTANDVIVGGGGADQITGGAGADKITLSGATSNVIQAVGASGTNSSTAIQTAELTSTFDVIYGAAAGDTITTGNASLIAAKLISLSAANLAVPGYTGTGVGTEDAGQFARGTYDAAAGTFTYAANGADTAFTYDSTATNAAQTWETIVLVGYVPGSTTAAALGVVTLG